MLDKLIFDRTFLPSRILSAVLALVLVVGISALPPYALGGDDGSRQASEATLETAEASADAGDDSATDDEADEEETASKDSTGSDSDEKEAAVEEGEAESVDESEAAQEAPAADDEAADAEEEAIEEAIEDEPAIDESVSDEQTAGIQAAEDPEAIDVADQAEEEALLGIAAIEEDEQAVARIGSEPYASLEDALEAAHSGDTIVLEDDVALEKTASIDKNLTIDFSGKTISYSGSGFAFDVEGSAKLSVKDGEASLAASSSAKGIFQVASGASLSLSDVKLIGNNGMAQGNVEYGLVYLASGSASGRTITLSNVTGETDFCILASASGSASANNATVTVRGGSFSRTYVGGEDEGARPMFYLNGANASFNGVSINAQQGTCLFAEGDAGSITLSGNNNFTTTTAFPVATYSSAALSITGGTYVGAIALQAGDPATVAVSGGTFRGAVQVAEGTPKSAIAITGGTFESAPDDGFIPKGYKFDSNSSEVVESDEQEVALQFENFTAELTYTGTAQTPEFGVKTTVNQPLTSDDYRVAYAVADVEGNNALLSDEGLPLNAGTYTVTVAGSGDFTDAAEASQEFSIAPAEVELIVAEIGEQKYTGKQLTPTVDVTARYVGAADAIEGFTADDYTVSYGENTELGADTGTVAVTAKGNYSGSAEATFGIIELTDAETVAQIGSVKYPSLAEAVAAAAAGQTVSLLKDVILDEKLVIDEEITLDLGGNTVTVNVAEGITAAKGANATLRNGTVHTLQDGVDTADVIAANAGTITLGSGLAVNAASSALYACNGGKINVAGAAVNSTSTTYVAAYVEGAGSQINVGGGTLSASGQTTLSVGAGSAVNITGGTVANTSADWVTLYVIGENARCNISGGTVSSEHRAALSPCNGVTTVSGSAVVTTAATYAVGTYANNAVFNMIGGTIENTGGTGEHYGLFVSNTATANISGGTIATDGKYGIILNGDGVASISGGTVLGEYALGKANDATFAVSGGEFSTVVAASYCAEGYIPVYDMNANGRYTVKKGVAVARIGGKVYEDLASAMVEAVDGDIVTLLADTTEYVPINLDGSITLDLGGNTLTAATPADSATSNDKAVALHILQGSLAVKNGSVVSDSDYAVWANGPSTVSLAGDASVSSAGYALFVEFGAKGIVSGSTIVGGSDDFAAIAVAGENSTLTVSGGSITGRDGAAAADSSNGAKLAVSGGTFKGGDELLATENNGEIAVSGGWFTSPVAAEHCATGWAPSETANSDGLYTVIEDLDVLVKAEEAVDELLDALAVNEKADGASWNQVIRAAYRYNLAAEAVRNFQDVENGLAKGSYQNRIEALQTKLASVKKLDMSGKDIAENTFYDGTDAGSLAVYTGLETLDLSNTGVTDFGSLAGLTSLRDLSLAGNDVDNGIYGPIVGLSNLTRLDLSDNPKITAIGPLTTNGAGAGACAQSIEILNVSNTGITQMQEVWNGAERAASLPALKTLVADGLELTSISGLVEIVNAGGFDADGLLWRLGGSSLLSDPDNHVGMIQAKFADTQGTFIPPITAVAKIEGGSYYGSLTDAIAAATPGATVLLQSDTSEAVDVSKSVTIDLGGHTLSAAASDDVNGGAPVALYVSGESVLVKNGVVAAEGDWDLADAIVMEAAGSHLTLGDALTVKSNTEVAYVIAPHASIIIDGAQVVSTDAAFYAFLMDGSSGGNSLVVKSGSIEAAGPAVSAGQGTEVVVSGGLVSAISSDACAIEANGSTTSITITGGVVKADGTPLLLAHAATASLSEDASLVSASGNSLVLQGGYSEAEITGGSLTGPKGIQVAYGSTLLVSGDAMVTATAEGAAAIEAEIDADVQVSGGWFSSKLFNRYCANDFHPTETPADDPEGYYTVVPSYTIKFVNEDGTLLSNQGVIGGEMPVYEGDIPTKDSGAQYTYTFKGWDKELAPAAEDTTYTAVYDAELNSYAVTFYDEDGQTILDEQTVDYGTVPSYAGAEPTKASNGQRVYAFAGWDPALSAIEGDTEYYATYSDSPATFTVTWENEDGTVLDEQTVEYGSKPSYQGGTPEKAADAQYSYTFSGWNGDLDQAITSDVTFTAQYDETLNSYTVTFANDGGTTLYQQTLDYGQLPSYRGDTPTKASDAQYSYTFSGWDKEFAAVEGNTTYTAQYSGTVRSYTVSFENHDGTELQRATMEYGMMPSYNGADPVRGATAQYTYTWNGWDKAIEAVSGDVTYTAVFASEVNSYTVRFVNDNGDILDTLEVPYGSLPAYQSESPTKAATDQYTYEFAGWAPEIAPVEQDVTYTATYTPRVKEYEVTFKNADGSTLQSGMVPYGELPSYAGTPTQAADAQYTYVFAGWDKELAPVTGAATYTATYTSSRNSYTITWVDDDGTVLHTERLAYGITPSYNVTPTKASDSANVYRFAAWSPRIAAVSGNQTYRATYNYITVSGGNTSVSLAAGSTRALSVNASSAVTWTSSNPAFATVSASGVVTAVAPGSATITATMANGLAIPFSVTVTAANNASNSDNTGNTSNSGTNGSSGNNGTSNGSNSNGNTSGGSNGSTNTGSASTGATNANSGASSSGNNTASASANNGTNANSGSTASGGNSNSSTSGNSGSGTVNGSNANSSAMGNATGTTVGTTTTAAGNTTRVATPGTAFGVAPGTPVVSTDSVAAGDANAATDAADANADANADAEATAETIEDDANALAAAPGGTAAPETIEDDANALSGGDWDVDGAGLVDNGSWWLWALAIAAVLGAGFIWFLLAKRRKDDEEEEAATA